VSASETKKKRSYRKVVRAIVLVAIVILISRYVYYSYYESPPSIPTAATSTYIPLRDSDFSLVDTSICWRNATAPPFPVLLTNFVNRLNEPVHIVNSSITYGALTFSNGTTVYAHRTHPYDTQAFTAPNRAFAISLRVSTLSANVRMTAANVTISVFVLELDGTVNRTINTTIPVHLQTCPVGLTISKLPLSINIDTIGPPNTAPIMRRR
jgi:hypothetical protein